MIDKILESVNLKYEDLTSAERDTLLEWSQALETNKLSVSVIKNYIVAMRDSVEQKLAVSDLGSKEDILLKARLRNYMLLEAFLSTPEKARQAIDRAIAGIVNKRNR